MLRLSTIPSWNPDGLLPPVDPESPTSADRSPYCVSLDDVVLRFSETAERRAILYGFLGYRSSLHAIGLTDGVQWLDGSFVEQIESGTRRRPPADVDVVTFFRLPQGRTQAELVESASDLFPSDAVGRLALKDRFQVDAYSVHLGQSSNRLLELATYWSGVWGHQRDTFAWKGFLQIDLAPTDDEMARQLLEHANKDMP